MCDKINITTERLKKLIEETGQTREFIANSIGCDTSMVTKHYNGSRNITVDYVVKYAKHFGVSTDYLLGVSAAQTNDKDISYICDYIGLSVGAVEELHQCTEKNFPLEVYQEYEDYIQTLQTENPDLLTSELWEQSIQFIKKLDIDNKSFLFILNELLTTANVDFRDFVDCLTQYCVKRQEIEKSKKLLCKEQTLKKDNEELVKKIDYIKWEIEDQTEYNEYLLFKTSKKIGLMANKITDNYIEFRGANNGNS